MKRTEVLSEITHILDTEWDLENLSKSEMILSMLENFMQPKKYINPKAMDEFGDIINEKGDHYGYIHYIDKYPEHYFIKGRPYQYYLEGWEEE